MHRYIINIFQSAGLKEEEEKKISFLHFYMNDIYNDVCRYSISSVKRGTITISRDSNEERSGAIPPSTKKLLLRRNIRLSQKFFFFFVFHCTHLFLQDLDRSYPPISMILYRL